MCDRLHLSTCRSSESMPPARRIAFTAIIASLPATAMTDTPADSNARTDSRCDTNSGSGLGDLDRMTMAATCVREAPSIVCNGECVPSGVTSPFPPPRTPLAGQSVVTPTRRAEGWTRPRRRLLRGGDRDFDGRISTQTCRHSPGGTQMGTRNVSWPWFFLSQLAFPLSAGRKLAPSKPC